MKFKTDGFYTSHNSSLIVEGGRRDIFKELDPKHENATVQRLSEQYQANKHSIEADTEPKEPLMDRLLYWSCGL